jgi:signal transduction histidine kinase
MDPTRIVLAGVVILAAVLAAALVAVLICLKKSHNEARLLKEQLDSAIKTDERRISFFSSMVHELKMPLSVILGAVQLIEIKQKNMQQDEKKTNGTAIQETAHMEKNIAAIKHNCHRMMKLTNDLIDLAKSETGYLRLRPVNCDLCALLDEIV